MKPVSNAHVVVRSPQRGLLAVLVLALVTAGAGDALAQPRGGGGKADKGAKGDKGRSGGDPGDAGDKKGGKPKVFDFTGIDISGRLRTPQLLYFLDRAAEELERASLERRSFIPEMVRSIDEEQL
ncbi:MAG: hypothetical protein KC464_21430 [Myxococcales bacterium]|nr:hypothetical protein [Myxococcales bacterium]